MTTSRRSVVPLRSILRIVLATAVVLLIPFIAMQFTDGVDWDETDFIAIGLLTSGAALVFELLTRLLGRGYRLAIGIVVAAAFLWLWAELAVGIFTNWGS